MQSLIRQHDKARLDGGTAIVAFPGAGFAPTLAAAYLSDELKLRPIGALDCEGMPSWAIVEQGQVVEPVRIMAGLDRTRSRKRHPLAIFISEIPVEEEWVRPVAGAILTWCVENKMRTVISIESAFGEGEPNVVPSIRLWGVSAHPGSNAKLVRAGLPLAQEGVVVGVTGSLLAQGLEAPMEIIGMGVVGTGDEPDIRCAQAIVEFLAKFLQLPIKRERLAREADRFEKHLKGVEHRRQLTDEIGDPVSGRDFI